MGRFLMKPFVILGYILMLLVTLIKVALVAIPVGLAVFGLFRAKDYIKDHEHPRKVE